MAKRGRRLWVKPEMTNGPLKLYVAKNVHVEGKPCEGSYDPQTAEVEVDDSWHDERKKRSAAHEMTHSALDALPDDVLEQIFGCKVGTDLMTKREELLCSSLEATLFGPLISGKLLRFPKPPKL